jgi:hypothetical protein
VALDSAGDAPAVAADLAASVEAAVAADGAAVGEETSPDAEAADSLSSTD